MAYWQHKSQLKGAWDCFIDETDADVYMFQEGRPLQEMIDGKNMVWNAIGGKRDWGSGVYSNKYHLSEENIDTQFKGVFTIASIEKINMTLISMYGLMTNGYSVPNLHRIFSDLTFLLNGQINGKRRIVLGGDLNASTQFDLIQKNNSHQIFFDRVEDFGLRDVYKLSGCKTHIQTLRYKRSKKPWQNDYFFISNTISRKFKGYKILDNERVREYSDHNMVVIEIEAL